MFPLSTRKKILIVNDQHDAGHSYTPFFQDLGNIHDNPAAFKLNPEKYELVVFTGGSDVNPKLYGDSSPQGYCNFNSVRDTEEEDIFKFAKANNVAMFGICRGLQFLNVMAGGKLIHHIIGHSVHNHPVSTSDTETFDTNSLHHQACIAPVDAEVIAWSVEKKSRSYIGNKDEEMKYLGPEIEAMYFPRCQAAGVQWHPEALGINQKGRTWAYFFARDIVKCTPNGMRRMYLRFETKDKL